MATTNINLRLNGVPRVGIIRAEAMFQGMVTGVEGQFGLSRLELTGDRGRSVRRPLNCGDVGWHGGGAF